MNTKAKDRPLIRPDGHAVHSLKTWPGPFQAVLNGTKRHEIRRYDRDFVPGDMVILREYDPATNQPTGRFARFRIGHLSPPSVFGVPATVCVFTLVEDSPARDEGEEETWIRTAERKWKRGAGLFDFLPVQVRHWLAHRW